MVGLQSKRDKMLGINREALWDRRVQKLRKMRAEKGKSSVTRDGREPLYWSNDCMVVNTHLQLSRVHGSNGLYHSHV
jgi:hypothetical protein